jgi:hypothetical protein
MLRQTSGCLEAHIETLKYKLSDEKEEDLNLEDFLSFSIDDEKVA